MIVIEQFAVSNSTVLNQELNWGSTDWNKEAKIISLFQVNQQNIRLDKTKKQMLIDFQFNGGAGMVDKFKNFREGLFTGDKNKIIKEYKRGYTDKNKNFKELVERNKEFANFFFKKLNTDNLERVEKNIRCFRAVCESSGFLASV